MQLHSAYGAELLLCLNYEWFHKFQ